ncbi:hypothetical protein JYT76_01255 [Olleya sp. AH-315-F22]|nr:hypothetical protein [Olleya sp. AH-315-F22]
MKKTKTNHIIIIKDDWIKENTDFEASFPIEISNRINNLRGEKLLDELDESKNLTFVNSEKKITLKTNQDKVFGYLHKNKLNESVFSEIQANKINFIGLKDYMLVNDSNDELRLSYDLPSVSFCIIKKGKKIPSNSGCIISLLLIIFSSILYSFL